VGSHESQPPATNQELASGVAKELTLAGQQVICQTYRVCVPLTIRSVELPESFPEAAFRGLANLVSPAAFTFSIGLFKNISRDKGFASHLELPAGTLF